MSLGKRLQSIQVLFSMACLYIVMLLFLAASFNFTPFVYSEPIITYTLPLPAPKEVVVQEGNPASLTLPTLSIEKPVLDGQYSYESNSWSLTPTGVHYATMTSLPNDYAGNTFMYAHNHVDAFGPLENLNIGEKAIITTTNGLVFTYVYTAYEEFNPEDTSALSNTKTPQLTLQTCSGSWNESRKMFYFDLKNVEEV